AIVNRPDARRADTLLDHEAGAVVGYANEMFGEARRLANHERLPARNARQSPVVMRVQSPFDAGPPCRRHGINEGPIIVAVHDVACFGTQQPCPPPKQAEPKTAS